MQDSRHVDAILYCVLFLVTHVIAHVHHEHPFIRQLPTSSCDLDLPLFMFSRLQIAASSSWYRSCFAMAAMLPVPQLPRAGVQILSQALEETTCARHDHSNGGRWSHGGSPVTMAWSMLKHTKSTGHPWLGWKGTKTPLGGSSHLVSGL